jgi:hypothetical protein
MSGKKDRERRRGEARAEFLATFPLMLLGNPLVASQMIEELGSDKSAAYNHIERNYQDERLTIDAREPHLQALFDTFLPQQEPGVVVSIGCGEGLEFGALRRKYRSATLVGIDNTEDSNKVKLAIVSTGLARGYFLHKDLRTFSSSFLDSQKGSPLVVARHPGPLEGGFSSPWVNILQQWATKAVAKGGRMFITSYHPKERVFIAECLRRVGLQSQLATFSGGDDLVELARSMRHLDRRLNALSEISETEAFREANDNVNPVEDSQIILVSG